MVVRNRRTVGAVCSGIILLVSKEDITGLLLEYEKMIFQE